MNFGEKSTQESNREVEYILLPVSGASYDMCEVEPEEHVAYIYGGMQR